MRCLSNNRDTGFLPLKKQINIQSALGKILNKANVETRLQDIVHKCRLIFDCQFSAITYSVGSKEKTVKYVFSSNPSYENYDVLATDKIYREQFKSNLDSVFITEQLHGNSSNGAVENHSNTIKIPRNSGLLVPILDGEKTVIALLQLIDKNNGLNFSESERQNAQWITQLFQGVFEFEKKIEELTKTNLELQKNSTKLSRLAKFDNLTGLYNRSSLQEKLVSMLELAKEKKQSLAVALLDLDHFKEINDTLGHKVGDSLLKTVANRIQKCARKEDVVSRLGGDEFVIVIDNPISQSTTLDILQRILDEISKPIKIAHRSLDISCSIGYSLYPEHGNNLDTLLQHADSAMYQAKRNEKGNFQYFSPEIQQQIEARILLEKDLEQAVESGDFELHYQPQMDMRTGSIVGLEALIRWKHTRKGYIPPNDFIPLAEEVGLILPIGDWVFRSACQQIARWQKKRIKVVPISINLSVKQLVQPDLASHLNFILKEEGVTVNQITIEITEGLFLDDVEKHINILEKLKELGFRISIDDFGTGYSNLNYLKRFPIDEIKIDRSFVNEITTDPHDKAIATTIIAIAHNFGFKVVSEGIEKKSQLALLAKNQCDVLQGFYFSKPLPENECEQLLSSGKHLDLDGIRPKDYQRAILLVDDEPNILKSLGRVLRRVDAKIFTANNSKEALEILALNEIGIILSDLEMPEVNGIELLDKVQKMHSYTVRMILSGNAEFEKACDAINRSAIHRFITKPWSDEHLCKEIEDAFQLYESQFY